MGSESFQERAARMATRLGVVVENTELQTIIRDEQRWGVDRQDKPPAAPTLSPPDPRRRRPGRSRGLER
jgi:hypothetical protein